MRFCQVGAAIAIRYTGDFADNNCERVQPTPSGLEVEAESLTHDVPPLGRA